MNKFILFALLAICAFAAASWTWIEEEEEGRPALTSKFDHPEDTASALAVPLQLRVPEAPQVQQCTGCTAYGTKTCQGNGFCVKKCAYYGSVSCPSDNTLAYQEDEDEDVEHGYSLIKPENYITKLMVVWGGKDVSCSEGFTKIPTDLLRDPAADKFLYLCTAKQGGKEPIVDIVVVKSSTKLNENTCPIGYQSIPFNLDQGVGKYMYLCYKKSQSGAPLVTVSFAFGKTTLCPSGFKRDTNNLSQGAGGYIWLCHKYDQDALDEIILTNVKYDVNKLVETEIRVKSVDSIEIDNPTSTALTGPTLSGSVSFTSTNSWSTTSPVALGVKLTVKAGVPVAGWEKPVQISASTSYATTTGGSLSETSKKSYSFSCVADAKTVTRFDVQYRQAAVEVPYSADALYKYKIGDQATKSFIGVYKGVSVSAYRMKKTIVSTFK